MKRAILLTIIPVLFFAQANYKIQKDVISSGGTKMTAGNYVLHGTVSQTTIGSVTGGNYKGIIGFWQPFDWVNPRPPYIVRATKSGNNVILTWNKVTLDVNGYPEVIQYYSVYKDTLPNYTPGSGTFVGNSTGPDTTYTDLASLNSTRSFYYLVKAVDYGPNRSYSSNMGFKFNKFYNENVAASDRNWVSMPYHTVYATASNITTDLSVAGDPLIKVTNLRNEQYYENWLWDPDFLEWYGVNFAVDSGRAYEMETIKDTILYLVGWDNPNGYITLNENAAATDRNWVSVPYNATYAAVSAITTEYSVAGNPLIKLTNLRNEQFYENWLWDPDFLEWYGVDFAVERGRGYEFETIRDTVWNPTQYNNNAKDALLLARSTVRPDVEVHCGNQLYPDRSPVWDVKTNAVGMLGEALRNPLNYRCMTNAAVGNDDDDQIVSKNRKNVIHESGISHVVRLRFTDADVKDVVFTAYRLSDPHDVLTNHIIGCGTARKKDVHAIWFDVGNFRHPWLPDEEVMVIVEAVKDGRGVFGTRIVTLDKTMSIQDVGLSEFKPIPDLMASTISGGSFWTEIDNPDIVGYSIYKNDQRVNSEVITKSEYALTGNADLKPVIMGGYETYYGSSVQETPVKQKPLISYAMSVQPNPFKTTASVKYALARPIKVDISVFDLSGRRVVILANGYQEAGYYQLVWSGTDNVGRHVATGVYFIRMETDDYMSQEKIIYVR